MRLETPPFIPFLAVLDLRPGGHPPRPVSAAGGSVERMGPGLWAVRAPVASAFVGVSGAQGDSFFYSNDEVNLCFINSCDCLTSVFDCVEMVAQFMAFIYYQLSALYLAMDTTIGVNII
jgi:hypothetical protein